MHDCEIRRIRRSVGGLPKEEEQRSTREAPHRITYRNQQGPDPVSCGPLEFSPALWLYTQTGPLRHCYTQTTRKHFPLQLLIPRILANQTISYRPRYAIRKTIEQRNTENRLRFQYCYSHHDGGITLNAERHLIGRLCSSISGSSSCCCAPPPSLASLATSSRSRTNFGCPFHGTCL